MDDRFGAPVPLSTGRKLWSLWDMLKFYAYPFMATLCDLGRAIRALDDVLQKGDPPVVRVGDAIRYLERDVPKLPVSSGIRGQLVRLREHVNDKQATTDTLRALLFDFEAALTEDLKRHLYLVVPVEQRGMFESPMPFGMEVYQRFRAATDDIQAANRCMVLNEPTAEVFHLMRAAEHGLRVLARRLHISNVEIKAWETVLQDVDRRLKAMGSPPGGMTPRIDRRLRYYHEARTDLAGFKHAWRNHVMHAKKTYTAEEAAPVYAAVRSLMERLAVSPPK